MLTLYGIAPTSTGIRIARSAFFAAAALQFGAAVLWSAAAQDVPARLKGTGEVVITSGGGTWEDAQRKAFFDPFQRDTGIKVVLVPEDHAKLLASVKTGVPEADLTSINAGELGGFDRQGAVDEIDYGLFDKATIDNISAPLKNKKGVGAILYSIAVGYNTQKYPPGKAQPANWVDFYDLAKFPGPRGLSNCAKIIDGGLLEGAIMGDGVPADKVYPIDMNRAFAKLEKIKPSVKLWWEAGAAAPQALVNGEVDISSAYNGRIFAAQQKGAPVAMSWDQSLIQYDYWIVMKNAPNKANAMKFLAYISEAKPQAEFAKAISYGPVNNKAYDFIPKDIQDILPGSPKNAKVQLYQDYEWWNAKGTDGRTNWDAAVERCTKLLSQ